MNEVAKMSSHKSKCIILTSDVHWLNPLVIPFLCLCLIGQISIIWRVITLPWSTSPPGRHPCQLFLLYWILVLSPVLSPQSLNNGGAPGLSPLFFSTYSLFQEAVSSRSMALNTVYVTDTQFIFAGAIFPGNRGLLYPAADLAASLRCLISTSHLPCPKQGSLYFLPTLFLLKRPHLVNGFFVLLDAQLRTWCLWWLISFSPPSCQLQTMPRMRPHPHLPCLPLV